MSKRKIRELTEVEKKCADKYRAQLGEALRRLQAAEQEAASLRGVLSDLAIVYAGREGPVEMTVDALYEPVDKET